LSEAFIAFAKLGKGFDDDSGRGDGKDCAQEDAVHGAPAE